jgi:hypothetical protein
MLQKRTPETHWHYSLIFRGSAGRLFVNGSDDGSEEKNFVLKRKPKQTAIFNTVFAIDGVTPFVVANHKD